jgi:hypothetical protein
MKRLLLIIFTALLLMPAFSQGGHYKGGKGSSHKGGKYKNASTGDHYRKRKH